MYKKGNEKNWKDFFETFWNLYYTSFNRKFNKRKTGSEKWIIEFSFDYAF